MSCIPYQESSMLKPGDRLPPFSLMASNGAEVSEESLAGQRFVLYSYPKDDTPGCTKEACSFRDNLPKFGELGVAVYGLSADDETSHIRFGRKYSLGFPLLADPERRLIEPLGVWVEKSMYGKTYMGVSRSTFIVGPNGVIEHVWEKVNPEGHAEEVLAWLRSNRTASAKTPAAKTPATKPVKAARRVKAQSAPAHRARKPKATAKAQRAAQPAAKPRPKKKPIAKTSRTAKAKPAGKAKVRAKTKSAKGPRRRR